MNSTALRYMDFLKMKLRVLEDIRKNTAEQSDALEKKDYDLLGKLLKGRQEYVEKFEQIMRHSSDYDLAEKNEETEKWEQAIRFLIREVVNITHANMKAAENQKNDMAGVIRNLNLGKHALQDGYFKKMPQRYGYFIDKKVGNNFKVRKKK